MTTLYLISGLGADRRLYNNIDIPKKFNTKFVEWIAPDPNDTIPTYAGKLIKHYHIEKGSILIGTSLGGIVAVEIAKQIEISKVVLISSIKTSDEAPFVFKLFKLIPLIELLPNKLLTTNARLVAPVFGNMSTDDIDLFDAMLRGSSPDFIRWAMRAILRWQNSVVPANVYHIIGDKDLIFSSKKIKGAAVISGGTHMMVLTRAS